MFARWLSAISSVAYHPSKESTTAVGAAVGAEGASSEQNALGAKRESCEAAAAQPGCSGEGGVGGITVPEVWSGREGWKRRDGWKRRLQPLAHGIATNPGG
ncbi:hypothetical protein B0H19DRAFT_1081143 [Mycena capillaripes]|nr:hypothetical protein B0H19DRAFT_1081143 [Mycena capillaripes]